MNNVVIGILGTKLDNAGWGKKRWHRWRPSLSVLMHDDFPVHRFELLHSPEWQALAELTKRDMELVSPQTQVTLHCTDFDNPWDFEQVYSALHDFSRQYQFDVDKNQYYIHITTGTHVAQICLYLLTEAHFFPGVLLQTSPSQSRLADDDEELSSQLEEPSQSQWLKTRGSLQWIDLDLSRYDQIAKRFATIATQGTNHLKSGINTSNQSFNKLIEQIEQVAIRSKHPVLLMGATGVGKSHLAKKIYELKKNRGQLKGEFIEVNCATLRGDQAMSTLFGHVKGAFTGAASARVGLLREAHLGLLFLDEIGELGLDEQAMLLRAIEDKVFYPFGADSPVRSDFQLIAGTNRQLFDCVKEGTFREDLLARINLWTYELPSLKDRREDIEPNIDYELERASQTFGQRITMNKSAKNQYIAFAVSPDAHWQANFRDLNASITRMATLAEGGRINEAIVQHEINRLQKDWQRLSQDNPVVEKTHILNQYLSQDKINAIDYFDQVQLASVLQVCENSTTLAQAGRQLFQISRLEKNSSNDTHRLRSYLQKFGLTFSQTQ